MEANLVSLNPHFKSCVRATFEQHAHFSDQQAATPTPKRWSDTQPLVVAGGVGDLSARASLDGCDVPVEDLPPSAHTRRRSFLSSHSPLTTSNMVLTIRRPAPAFTAEAVVDGEFKTISLSDYKGKYVVLFFYPLDFTFVCPTEICAFSDRIEDFKKLNVEVIGCSIDSKFSHLAWINTPRKKGGLGPMNIPLIGDISKDLATKYEVLVQDGEGDIGVAFRGLFIIDKEGILRQITINDLPIGRNVDEVLRLIEAFQYNEEHGEVCPAGWKKGKKGMTANPTDSLKYFETLEEPSAKKRKADE